MSVDHEIRWDEDRGTITYKTRVDGSIGVLGHQGGAGQIIVDDQSRPRGLVFKVEGANGRVVYNPPLWSSDRRALMAELSLKYEDLIIIRHTFDMKHSHVVRRWTSTKTLLSYNIHST
ncbi:hypothetical protein ACOSQ3_003963 [Xanthoceras sorbifolium]